LSAFPQREGCETDGFEKIMWKFTIDGHRNLLGAQIVDFVIACQNQPVLDAFRKRLLESFDGTYEGFLRLEHYLGCQIARDLLAGTREITLFVGNNQKEDLQ